MLTSKELLAIMPNCPKDCIEVYIAFLNLAMDEGDINTLNRVSAFLGQLALESGELRYFEELASGKAYEGRKDLGNTEPGDGIRFKGRGPIQLTGRSNYRIAGQALGLDLEANPLQAAKPEVGFRIAVWYWNSRKLNDKADIKDYKAITKAINGAATDGPPSHHIRRIRYYEKALQVLKDIYP